MRTYVSQRDKLLDAAEQLFAHHGVHAASIRDITSAAQSNLASINYHFGSKQNLVRAVLHRRAQPINAERFRLLDEVEANYAESAPPLDRILRAFLAPAIPLLQTHPHALCFVGRLLTEHDPALRTMIDEEFHPVLSRFTTAIHRALPGFTQEQVLLSLRFTVGAMLFVWITRDPNDSDPTTVVDRLVHFATTGFQSQIQGASS